MNTIVKMVAPHRGWLYDADSNVIHFIDEEHYNRGICGYRPRSTFALSGTGYRKFLRDTPFKHRKGNRKPCKNCMLLWKKTFGKKLPNLNLGDTVQLKGKYTRKRKMIFKQFQNAYGVIVKGAGTLRDPAMICVEFGLGQTWPVYKCDLLVTNKGGSS